MERISIGVEALDRTLMGGLPKGSVTLVLGPPGAGKSILSKQFLRTGLVTKTPSILTSTSESFETVRDTVQTFGWGTELFDQLLFLDCFSWRIGGSKHRYQANLASLTDVSITLGKLIEEAAITPKDGARLVIDSFSDAIKYGGGERALKLIDAIRTRLRSHGVTTLVLVEEGVHEDRIIHAVEYSVDGTIRMKLSEQGRFMMVSRMMATPVDLRWIPFVIGR